MIEAELSDALARVRIENENLRRENEELRRQLVRRLESKGLIPSQDAPVQTHCRHGKEFRGENHDIGCDAPCKNKFCHHPCGMHRMNCLTVVGLDDKKRPVYCQCVGLNW